MGDTGTAGAASRRDADALPTDASSPRRTVVAPRVFDGPDADDRPAIELLEEAVAKALAPLSLSGWQVLHDRVIPSGGNIDHLVVGPGSVIVLDVKAWNGRLEVRDGKLYNGEWSQTKALAHLATQRDAVRDALRGTISGFGPVDMALVITTQPDFGPDSVGGTVVIGLRHLAQAIESSRSIYSADKVDEVVAVLLQAFPPAGTLEPSATGLHHIDGLELGDLFNRSNRFMYVTTTTGAGNHRMYLRDEDGEQFGYKDMSTGELHLDHADDPMVEYVLRSATQTGMQLRADTMPKVRVRVPPGRLLPLFDRLHSTVIIGNRWTGRSQDRLYGTLANPTEGVFDLGFVDLTTGWVTPTSRGPLSRERGPAERYLGLLRDRCPFAYGPPAQTVGPVTELPS